ncbi:MAG TPA: TIGR02302 family protein [Azospirillaceae bacterium]|nr:TIGR02302 family protein [Azospirillaceae bacterium]
MARSPFKRKPAPDETVADDGSVHPVRRATTPPPVTVDPSAPRPGEPLRDLQLARAAAGWERLWPALWPATSVAGLFLAAAWLDLLPRLGGWLHLLVLLGFLAAFVSCLAAGFRGFSLPGWADARRRLERDSGLQHRPLATLRDAPAGSDPVSLALWRVQQQRARDSVRGLSVRVPHPNVAARDPWALRAAVLLLLVVAATAARGDWGPRLASALSPTLGLGGAVTDVALDVWVTPPDYTRQPPIFLSQLAAQAKASGAPEPGIVDVPVGSTLLARVGSDGKPPVLALNGEELPFQPVPGGGFQLEAKVTGGTSVAVTRRGRTLGEWDIRVVPDMPPGITFRGKPAPTERFALKIDYSAADDYGIAKVAATFRLVGENIPAALDRTPFTQPLPVPGVTPKEANASGFFDLTPHPWAGLLVSIRLEATDAAGQTAASAEQMVQLPERPFAHPVARELIAQRKRLILEGEAAREPAGTIIHELSARPEAYGGDLRVFMALRAATARLALDRRPEALPAMWQLLWDTALRIEDGGLSIAERDLRDAQKRLMEALDRNADSQEIQQLMQELRQAMDQFMNALEEQMRQAMERGEMPPESTPPPGAEAMSREDLEQMMRRMEELAQTGSKDAAREMLSQLQQMMENLRTGQMSEQERQQAEQAQQMQQMMQELQGLTQKQQQLMDETYRQSDRREPGAGQQDEQGFPQPGQRMPNRQGRQPGDQQQGQEQQGQDQQGQQGQPMPGQQGRQGEGQQGDQQGGQQQGNQQSPGGMAGRQEALRRELGELMRRFGEAGGEIPAPLGKAERSMKDAGQALQQGDPDRAVPPQGQAVEALRQGMQSMQEQMQRQMQAQQRGMRPGQQARPGQRQGRDPLGRPLPGAGPFDTETVKIPEEGDLQRAREILEELRRRSGDPDRPRQELDYIDRLLKRF